MATHVWAFHLDGSNEHNRNIETTIERLKPFISEAEHVRANRYRLLADALRFIAGRALVRALLISHSFRHLEAPMLPADITFDESKDGGKPHLSNSTREKWCPDITDFNISHDGDWAMAGITEAGILGVDVARASCPEGMSVDQFIDEFSFQLTAAEQEYLHHHSKQSLRDFFYIWTIKEAYAKAIGRGITMDVTSIEVAFKTGEVQHVLVDGQACPLRLTTGTLGDDGIYIYAIASADTTNAPMLKIIQTEDICSTLCCTGSS